jgi:lipopolysaccharide transport system permease protein
LNTTTTTATGAATTEDTDLNARRIPQLVIEPTRGFLSLNLRDIWQYRELFYFLAWRDLKIRYKQTVFGLAWAIFQPFMTMVVFSIFFGKMAKMDSEGFPYPIFSYAALLPWTFFAAAVGTGSNSLVGSSHLISKVYFPRLIIPTASSVVFMLDFVVAFFIYIGLMVFYGVPPTWTIALVPAFYLLAIIAALGVIYWLSALNVQFRDVKYAVPFFVQLWLFVTPVIYSTAKVTALFEKVGLPAWLYGLNPMAGVVEGFRWALLGTQSPSLSVIASSTVVSIFLFISGALFFRRMERTFADVL